jgi:VIT1/CCC1 family predicted Fe2+/Mn2+ transporter
VAIELSQTDQLTVHAREELGIDSAALANPVQASVVSALSFIAGAIVPVVVVAIIPATVRVVVTMAVTLLGLVALGSLGAHLGGAPRRQAAVRVFIGGTLALLISLGIGKVTGSVL